MISLVDSLLNRITMYRLVLYYLMALVGAAIIASFFGLVSYSPMSLALSTLVVTGACLAGNRLFARTFSAATSVESAYITALILVLIMPPAASFSAAITLGVVSVWAIASKYIFAIGKKHLFNPAAFAAVLSSFALGLPATWWAAGNPALLPLVVIGGLLVVRKVQRFDLVTSFAAVALLATALSSASLTTSLLASVLHSSFFFFAFVMLTEPATTPPSRAARLVYGALVGLLFTPSVHFGSFYLTPELALLTGNLFSYLVSPKGRYTLTLLRIEQAGRDIYDFIFAPDRAFAFAPGQYLEWTLPHSHPDTRGSRRYFTIASAPTESELRLGVKFYPESSSFKRALATMTPGETLSAAQLSGNFTLPKDQGQPLVFIAGGIGITPFRSQLQGLLDRREARPITIFYLVKTAADIAYKPILDRAERELGIRTVYLLTDTPGVPPLDGEYIAREVPDWQGRTFYLSGPRGMVESFKRTLLDMGVARRRIKSDFFPGFA